MGFLRPDFKLLDDGSEADLRRCHDCAIGHAKRLFVFFELRAVFTQTTDKRFRLTRQKAAPNRRSCEPSLGKEEPLPSLHAGSVWRLGSCGGWEKAFSSHGLQ